MDGKSRWRSGVNAAGDDRAPDEVAAGGVNIEPMVTHSLLLRLAEKLRNRKRQ